MRTCRPVSVLQMGHAETASGRRNAIEHATDPKESQRKLLTVLERYVE